MRALYICISPACERNTLGLLSLLLTICSWPLFRLGCMQRSYANLRNNVSTGIGSVLLHDRRLRHLYRLPLARRSTLNFLGLLSGLVLARESFLEILC